LSESYIFTFFANWTLCDIFHLMLTEEEKKLMIEETKSQSLFEIPKENYLNKIANANRKLTQNQDRTDEFDVAREELKHDATTFYEIKKENEAIQRAQEFVEKARKKGERENEHAHRIALKSRATKQSNLNAEEYFDMSKSQEAEQRRQEYLRSRTHGGHEEYVYSREIANMQKNREKLRQDAQIFYERKKGNDALRRHKETIDKSKPTNTTPKHKSPRKISQNEKDLVVPSRKLHRETDLL